MTEPATNPEPVRCPSKHDLSDGLDSVLIAHCGNTEPGHAGHFNKRYGVEWKDDGAPVAAAEPAQDLPSRMVRYRPVCSNCGDTGTCPVCRGGGLNEPGLECPACQNTHRCHCLPGPATSTTADTSGDLDHWVTRAKTAEAVLAARDAEERQDVLYGSWWPVGEDDTDAP